ncbi:MAG: hypothetical protein FWC13_07470 [Oscillospiraceae bacterium]|nr:hypothetical protein [Oscillospiraceae bacterium]
MFEYFLKIYKGKVKQAINKIAKKANKDKADHEKNNRIEWSLLIFMLLALVGAIVFYILYLKPNINLTSTFFVVCSIVLVICGFAVELYRRKIKDKKFVSELREQYREIHIDPLIAALNELNFAGEEGLKWAIYHCATYKERSEFIRIGRWAKDRFIMFILPATGFILGQFFSSGETDVIIKAARTIIQIFAFLLAIDFFVFSLNDNRHKAYIDLEANLRYIQAQPELMAKLKK